MSKLTRFVPKMSSISESISVHSLSLPQSVRSETKEKFDAILKLALSKKRTESKEKLLDEVGSTTASSRNLFDEEIEEKIDKNYDDDENVSKKFMLNKFLNASDGNEEQSKNIITFVKPPVPKPRTKTENRRRNSNSSTGTFSVTSPKVLNKSPITDPKSSVGTLQMPVPKTSYTGIDKTEPPEKLGDVILHNSPTVSKIEILSTRQECSDNRLSDGSDNSRGTFTVKKGAILNGLEQEEHIVSQKGPDLIQVKAERPKPKKRERKHKGEANVSSLQIDDSITPDTPYNYKNITEIIIHKTDRLLLNSFVIHPVVKTHIVDINTGKYYQKSNKNRPVVFYYENDSQNYILPVMSGYYNLQEKRTYCPMWEETILLNEDFKYLVNENVIVFFEIVDFAPAHLGTQVQNKECEKGWYKIAFAFLKIMGKNNVPNTYKKLRLQLYYPQTTPSKIEYNHCPIWDWWRKKKLKKYPSTLFVTIKEVINPKRVIDTFRSKTPLQKEEIDKDGEINEDKNNDDQVEKDAENLKLKWKNMLQKDDVFPEECIFRLGAKDEGCFVMEFSNNGLYIACAVKQDDDFQVLVYSVDNFEEHNCFKSHQSLIYSIVWSKDDKYLLSASSDNTVAVWNHKKNSFLQILPHPSFVYSCQINTENVISTGCYDRTIRIWTFNNENYKFELSQELEKHRGYITSLSFSIKDVNLLYSADSFGEIFEWLKKNDDWVISRKLDIVDLRDTKINQIKLFPNEKKMLVHSRDSALRIISLANVCVIHWLRGALNIRVQTFSDISSNGLYVASGSENGLVIVWDSKTGKRVKTYDAFMKKSKAAHCVVFHPKLNILAISHYGSNEPVLVFGSKSEQECNYGKENIDKICSTPTENIEKSETDKNDFRRVLRKMDQLLV